MVRFRFQLFALVCGLVFAGCSDDKEALEPEPVKSEWNASVMDRTVRPGNDFYRYAVGNWWEVTQEWNIDCLSWRSFDEETLTVVDNLRETDERIGREYAAMTDAAGQEASLVEIAGMLDELEKAGNSREELVRVAAQMGREGYLTLWDDSYTMDMNKLGAYYLFMKASTRGVFYPKRYAEEITRVLEAMDVEKERAVRVARNAVEIESLISEWNREIEDGKMWLAYMEGLGMSGNMMADNLLQAFGLTYVFDEVSVESLRDYLMWRLVHRNLCVLPNRVSAEGEWIMNNCDRLIDSGRSVRTMLRDVVMACHTREVSVGLYDRLVTPGFSAFYERLARETLAEVRRRIEGASWIRDVSTREEALRKLDAMEVYLSCHQVVTRGATVAWSSAAACLAAVRADRRAEVSVRIGKPMYTAEMWENYDLWWLGAGYTPPLNSFNIQSRMFVPGVLPNLGDTGFVCGYLGVIMAHEVMHGFDSNGRYYGAEGDLRDWWTAGDARRFEERTGRLSDYLSTLTFGEAGYPVDGERVLRETISDFGGLSVAYAVMKRLTDGKELRDMDGFTAAQRFFFGYAWSMGYADPEEFVEMYVSNEHLFMPLRMNVSCAHCDSWYEAFPEVKEGDRWYVRPEDRIKIW